MITEKELKTKMDYVRQICPAVSLHSPRDQDKMLNHIISITKNALQEQLIIYEPNAIVVCTLKIFFYYNETLAQTDIVCEWKRRRKCRLAKECYNSLLQIYVPEKSNEILEAVLNMIYEDKLWEFETFCFEIMCNLLENGVNASLMIHAIWDKIEDPNINVEDTRKIIRILYELLDIYDWPDTHDTVVVIERILNLFYISITSTHSTVNFIPYATLKKGLEVCILNMVKHVYNDHLLIIVQHMCSWVVEEGMTDEIILEFGSTLEYTAYVHEVTLYEKTLTPKIFPLLMEMIASTSKITNLLGNRVIQYLLDRKENKMNFDTPKIFFKDTQFDLTVGTCFKEDKLFCKLHREILHDSLLKSIINHCGSRMNLETTYCTICLIAIEVPCGFTAAALVCLLMNLQDVTLKQNKYPAEVSYHLHATVIAIMSLLCWIHKAKVFYEYVNKIVTERAQWAPHLNPPIQSQYNFAAHHILWNKPDLFFVDWEARYGLWKCFRLREEDTQEIYSNIFKEIMSGEQFSLVWNSFPRNLSSGLYTLLTDEQLVDVTLAAEGQILRAHKLILSVCSTYFRELFKGNSCKHPIVILKDVNYRDLSAMLHFMYQGEVNIKQEDIASFLKVAETLQIKGLTTETEEKLEETLTKNAENLDQIFNTERSSIKSVNSDVNAPVFEEQKQFVQKSQQCQKQCVLSKDKLHNNEFIENTNISDMCCQQDSTSDSTYNMQDMHMMQDNTATNIEDEPLDCTADIGHTDTAKHEPLDYTLDVDTETGYKTCLPNESLYKPEENIQTKDHVPDMQLVPYNQDAQTQPFGLSNMTGFESEFTYETGCHSKGRRTVKGISNNSLPLETTLRVVSELGPTLRMERGKVIRMYSCPWCLRHFTRKENLKLHVRYIHGPLESLTCKLCGNKYKNSNSLRVHSYLYHNAKRDKPNKPLVDGGV